MTRNQKIIFIAILLVGAFFIFFRLSRHDLLGDDATYAFRSIGYFDYMASDKQTTPVQWFGDRPWWSYLSFHDHPPLYFLIHFLFFKFFGVSVLVSRLPSALAGVGTLVIVFFLGKELAGVRLGLMSMGVLALNNYFIWTARVGLLESAFIFFMLLGLWFFLKGLQTDKKFLFSGLFFGLSFLTKYTFLYFVPAILIFLLWKRRDLFRNQNFWRGVTIFLLVASPVLFYNLHLLATRGHFDVQFDRLFTRPHSDWNILQVQEQQATFDPRGVARLLAEGYSFPYVLLFGVSLVAAIWAIRRSKQDAKLILLLLIFFSIFLGFSSTGAAPRWLGVTAPFSALILAFGITQAINWQIIPKPILLAVGFLAASFSVYYLVNTNHLITAPGSSRLYAYFRIENLGYNQLDKRFTNILTGVKTPDATKRLVHDWWYRNIFPEAIAFEPFAKIDERKQINPLIVYSSKTNWFPDLWIFEKWKLYNGILILNSQQFLKGYAAGTAEIINDVGITDLYYITPGRSEEYQKIVPEIVYDEEGHETFYIYHRILK